MRAVLMARPAGRRGGSGLSAPDVARGQAPGVSREADSGTVSSRFPRRWVGSKAEVHVSSGHDGGQAPGVAAADVARAWRPQSSYRRRGDTRTGSGRERGLLFPAASRATTEYVTRPVPGRSRSTKTVREVLASTRPPR